MQDLSQAALFSLIGNTPLVEVTRMDTGPCRLFLKLESQNPGGSIKDRVGRAMIEAAERDGRLRPGGTVSGPTMFELADLAMYAAVLSRIGPVALTVTTGANIDFMRKPAAGRDLLAECRLLKLGSVLAVGDARLTDQALPLLAPA